ncbi:hypothetical protein MNV49_000583 [Pseudohyphozyma bogoriensis]|nr:hypothetical protein MNV49_000583 [Pseudohyphozyma bogoriensis]
MVPGHAIFTGCDASTATFDKDWILEPYQHDGTVKTLIRHLSKGAEIAVQDPEALLVYSGGQTRPGAELSEAQSYARLAKAGNVYEQFMVRDPKKSLHPAGSVFERVTTEEFALDSMSNLLFSIARFKEFTGHYPTHITVVGFAMKRRRFEEIHRAALRWPISAFKYVGIDNDEVSMEAFEGERTNGLEPFLKDRYGCKGLLLAKKRKRNPYRRYHPYISSAPELEKLFEYCPKNNELFSGKLPWD